MLLGTVHLIAAVILIVKGKNYEWMTGFTVWMIICGGVIFLYGAGKAVLKRAGYGDDTKEKSNRQTVTLHSDEWKVDRQEIHRYFQQVGEKREVHVQVMRTVKYCPGCGAGVHSGKNAWVPFHCKKCGLEYQVLIQNNNG